jgi:peptidoglycan/xylan/chitin deacetylase (PgdA/CDA1 family)
LFIVNFHNVIAGALDAYDRSIAPRLDVPQFVSAIHWLSQRFEFISLDELVSRLGHAPEGGRTPAALTFDDGYAGILQHAFPVLRKRGIVASVMIVTQVLDSPKKLFHFEELEVAFRISKIRMLTLPDGSVQPLATTAERVACLEAVKQQLKLQPEPERRQRHEQLLQHLGVTRDQLEDASAGVPALDKLNIEQLKFLMASGWTIGAHTRTHRTLSCLGQEDLVQEIVGARDDIRSWFGPTALPFAYPYGGPQHIGERAYGIVASSGYCCALTTTAGRNTPDTDRHRLRRINIEALCQEHPEILDRRVEDQGSTPGRP